MEEKRYLTFALGKGRLAKKTLELFEKIGITCDEIRDPDTRKLIFVKKLIQIFGWRCTDFFSKNIKKFKRWCLNITISILTQYIV